MNTHFLTFQVSKLLTHLELKSHLHYQFFGGVNERMWKWFPMLQKKTCRMFLFTPLLRKTRPISGRLLPCEGTEGGGEGVSYGFFPSPRLEEVK